MVASSGPRFGARLMTTLRCSGAGTNRFWPKKGQACDPESPEIPLRLATSDPVRGADSSLAVGPAAEEMKGETPDAAAMA